MYKKRLSFYLFADTNIYCESQSMKTLVKTVNTELITVNKWVDINKLSFNINKINYIIIHSPYPNISLMV